METLLPIAVKQPQPAGKKFKFAVTSRYGRLVDLHFGHADEFLIYEANGADIALVETRQTDSYCLSMADCDEKRSRQEAVVDVIADCDAVITMRIGSLAQRRLHERGIYTVEYFDAVEQGLVFAQQQLLKHRSGRTRHFEFGRGG
jgi:nitrogen fixation protein NifB